MTIFDMENNNISDEVAYTIVALSLHNANVNELYLSVIKS